MSGLSRSIKRNSLKKEYGKFSKIWSMTTSVLRKEGKSTARRPNFREWLENKSKIQDRQVERSSEECTKDDEISLTWEEDDHTR